MPSIEAQQKALDRLTFRFDALDKGETAPLNINSIPVGVNFSRKDSVYANLMEISISESEIVREEQAKVAHTRRKMLGALKKNAKSVCRNIFFHYYLKLILCN